MEENERIVWIICISLMLIILSIFFISGTYAGETFTHTFTEQNLFNCSVDNPTLALTLDSLTSTVSIFIPLDYNLKDFTITCYIQGSEIPVTHSGGGHHSHPIILNLTKNITNNSQQENSSEVLNTTFPTPADNNQAEWIPKEYIDEWATWDTNSTELNNETIGFVEGFVDFWQKYWIGLIMGGAFIVGIIYLLGFTQPPQFPAPEVKEEIGDEEEGKTQT
jgi:hypothetical protein